MKFTNIVLAVLGLVAVASGARLNQHTLAQKLSVNKEVQEGKL